MNEPELHYATDRRCYNGAFSSDMERQFKSQDDIVKQIQIEYPEFSVVYFPLEDKYLSFVQYDMVTNNFHDDKGQCLLEAWRVLIQKSEPRYVMGYPFRSN
jgi:ubiquinone/menaquinone biosynthesis C-methylase UbiE